jgi:hypothetical protein
MRAMPRLLMSRHLCLALACCLVLSGCAHWGTDPETVTRCERGFDNDQDWRRASPYTRSARKIWKANPQFEFAGRSAVPMKSATLWFKDAKKAQFASCSRHSCDANNCFWRVRLYSSVDGLWTLKSEYDLGRTRR